MSVVPGDSRYVPLVMQDYCAVPCCLSMAMLRRGLPLVAQELLAFHLGLALPAGDKSGAERFFNASAHATGEAGGVQPHEASFHPSVALSTLHIPLRFQFVPVSALDAEKLTSLLVELLSAEDDRDVLLHFDRTVLESTGSVRARPWGRTAATGDAAAAPGQHQQKHMCVLDSVSPASRSAELRLVDPAAHSQKWRLVDSALLLRAMQALGEEQLGGIWLLHGRNDIDSSDEEEDYSSPPHVTPPQTTPAVTPALTRQPSARTSSEDVANEGSGKRSDVLGV
jgi:hypothetical protein